jgi:hypothetical protein
VTLDPHKWLQQPMECGALLVREPGALERAFGVLPDYLAEADAHGEEVNFSDRGLQLSRGARAIKVWASLSTFGISAFRSVVDSGLDLALAAQQIIEDDLELELMSPAGLGIVCFRRVVDGASPTDIARVNAWLASQLEATGRAMVSSTRLHGAHALRMCVMNHLTQESDVRFALDFLARTPIPVDMVTGGVAPSAPCPRGLESLLSDEGRRMLEGAAIRTIVPPGSPIFAQWSTGRDFYVVAHGRVRVAIDDEVVRHLGPGEFFGEIAAFDWGSGYGYVRTASVVADSTAEIVQVPTEVFARLMATEAPWREYVLSTRSRRLATL